MFVNLFLRQFCMYMFAYVLVDTLGCFVDLHFLKIRPHACWRTLGAQYSNKPYVEL